MNNLTSKILCSTAIITLLNTSFYPLNAAGTDPLDENSPDKTVLLHQKNLGVENVLRENDKSADKVQSNINPELSENKLQSLEEFSELETKTSHLSNRHFKRAIGNEFSINQNTTGYQYSPSVASLTNGNVFVAWSNYEYGGAYDIHGIVFSPQGTASSNESVISEVIYGNQYSPSVVSLTNGNVFVAWESLFPGVIYGRVFSPQGAAINNEFGISQNATGGIPSVASLTNGNVFVAWDSYRTQATSTFPYTTQTFGIYGRVFYSNGTAISNEFCISQDTAVNQTSPSVASLSNGNVFVAWEGYNNFYYNINGGVFSPQGAAISSELSIYQESLISAVTYGSQPSPSVAGLSNGNVFVTWGSIIGGNAYGKVFYSNGTTIGNQFGINQSTTTINGSPSVVGLPNGNVFVAWEGSLLSQQNYDIFGRVFSPQGTAISNGFGINQVTYGDQTNPSVASLAGGNVFVAWDGIQTGNNEIYGRIVSGQGLTPSPTAVPNLNPTAAPTSSSNRLTPSWLIPAKVVIGEVKNLWNLATGKNENWKSLGIKRDESEDTLATSRPTQPIQRMGNYVKSWFSPKSWNEYFDSMERSVLDYSTSLVKETPSYHSLTHSTFKGNTPFVSNVSYSSTIGASFLPSSMVSGAIGQ